MILSLQAFQKNLPKVMVRAPLDLLEKVAIALGRGPVTRKWRLDRDGPEADRLQQPLWKVRQRRSPPMLRTSQAGLQVRALSASVYSVPTACQAQAGGSHALLGRQLTQDAVR